MKTQALSALGVLLAAALSVGAAEKKKGAAAPPDPAKMEEQTRLQIFLDRANFGPGKIDGREGEFTRKALQRFQKAGGGAWTDLSSVEPVFTEYQVTAEDAASIGEVPREPAEQAKLKALPYRTVLEAVAEKFHADTDFIKELNPELREELKEGDRVKVPNIEPFDLAAVKEIKPGEGLAQPEGTEESPGDDGRTPKAKDNGEAKDGRKGEGEEAESKPKVALHIDTGEKILEVRVDGQLKAAFPITPGSDSIPSPTGEWKVKGVARMPDFRWDKSVLKFGVRSDDAHILPPGPNNPVGVVWIALNKPGIGIHGTDDPETIGRAASHGCVRLANWDIVKLARMVKAGVSVTIE
jgi:lipoprotein-anchoring transpeptidase ErfK/SrfK